MTTRSTIIRLIGVTVLTVSSLTFATDSSTIFLPAPRKEGGKPLMNVLAERRTSRTFAATAIPLQTLSDMLWAGFGINRDDGRRTAPSARNWQEIDIYVVTEKGASLYDATGNRLIEVAKGDLRSQTGKQEFAASAPVNLVFVADLDRMKGAAEADIDLYCGADAGFISQNIYLFCASEGLGTVVRGSIDRKIIAKALALKGNKKVVLAQSVGYPVAP